MHRKGKLLQILLGEGTGKVRLGLVLSAAMRLSPSPRETLCVPWQAEQSRTALGDGRQPSAY